MDCPKPINGETTLSDLKMKKSQKFNVKDEKGKNHEIEIDIKSRPIKKNIFIGLLL